ncbi:PREDICTED: N-acetyltransferase 9-like protein [Ceratosolen solmsi marchali]|uniref:N-acetyltransferase 9-like protein n=1 Tax=Ceratosolen solmsi marchali TaxID=326594 RepID=A0AAJ7E2V8_9HYME|nr:PREDICTED: N-acetyltransferase 9-like protein [Ceratosolen solmsi marchali]
MKINKSTKITGKNIILIPYKAHHVLRYHEWMKSEELQFLTASEPLTLAEEYKMQESWCKDEDKCTFIILNKSLFEENSNEIDSMIGDTNLFFNNSENKNHAEMEVMIAETKDRNKGYGWEAIMLMLRYGIEKLNVKIFFVKISMYNEKSINIFTKLGFKEISRSEVFKEITLEKEINNEWLDWIRSQTIEATTDENYENNQS